MAKWVSRSNWTIPCTMVTLSYEGSNNILSVTNFTNLFVPCIIIWCTIILACWPVFARGYLLVNLWNWVRDFVYQPEAAHKTHFSHTPTRYVHRLPPAHTQHRPTTLSAQSNMGPFFSIRILLFFSLLPWTCICSLWEMNLVQLHWTRVKERWMIPIFLHPPQPYD